MALEQDMLRGLELALTDALTPLGLSNVRLEDGVEMRTGHVEDLRLGSFMDPALRLPWPPRTTVHLSIEATVDRFPFVALEAPPAPTVFHLIAQHVDGRKVYVEAPADAPLSVYIPERA